MRPPEKQKKGENMEELNKLDTEQRNPASANIDLLSSEEMVALINREDQGVQSVLVRGLMVQHRGGRANPVGIVHPLRVRADEENEITYDALTGAVSKEHITRMAQDRIDRQRAERSAPPRASES